MDNYAGRLLQAPHSNKSLTSSLTRIMCEDGGFGVSLHVVGRVLCMMKMCLVNDVI